MKRLIKNGLVALCEGTNIYAFKKLAEAMMA
jgi:hypothetical protein